MCSLIENVVITESSEIEVKNMNTQSATRIQFYNLKKNPLKIEQNLRVAGLEKLVEVLFLFISFYNLTSSRLFANSQAAVSSLRASLFWLTSSQFSKYFPETFSKSGSTARRIWV